MSIDKERKFLQLFMFAHKLALPVIRTFFVYNVLDCTEYNKDFSVYLEICKHTLYHLAVDVKCCQCVTTHTTLKATCRITMTQLLQMYSIDRSNPKHYKKSGSHATQQCMCGVTVRNECSLQDLDLSLIYSVLNGSALKDEKHQKHATWLTMIIKQRNELCHVDSLTKWTESDIQTMWGYLQGAVLGLASDISQIPDYKENIEMQIDLLKVADYGLHDIQPIIQTIKTEIQTIKSELDKSIDLEVFGSRLDSLRQKCDENKQEILNAMEEGQQEHEQLLHLIYDEVKRGNMIHHRNALQFDIQWSSEEGTNENGKGE
ncbi:uncharacterized protein LOC127725193 [Mytilus californianus]|uniref:uncharacterized protein LOC127725193 n=1 Tax=Mytilus californianus TaxID=6549 RepID=UPI0022464EC2|nr:uncharacterized protein LOC127725193 [Mytilus californianus]